MILLSTIVSSILGKNKCLHEIRRKKKKKRERDTCHKFYLVEYKLSRTLAQNMARQFLIRVYEMYKYYFLFLLAHI